MTSQELLDLNILIAEHYMGCKWYWVTNGIDNDDKVRWQLVLALPPEGGVGKHWIGCAGETRLATKDEIKAAKKSSNFETRFDSCTVAGCGVVYLLTKLQEQHIITLEKTISGKFMVSKLGGVGCGYFYQDFCTVADTFELAVCRFAKKLIT